MQNWEVSSVPGTHHKQEGCGENRHASAHAKRDDARVIVLTAKVLQKERLHPGPLLYRYRPSL